MSISVPADVMICNPVLLFESFGQEHQTDVANIVMSGIVTDWNESMVCSLYYIQLLFSTYNVVDGKRRLNSGYN